jgi:hypothetical protein
MHVHFRGNRLTESFPSSERLLWLRYSGFQASYRIAPSLRLFVPNGLQAYCHFSFLRGLCVVSASFLWLGFSAVFTLQPLPLLSPLGPLVPGGALIRWSRSRVFTIFFPSVRADYLGWPVFLHFQLLLCLQSLLSFQRRRTFPQCPDACFRQCNGSLDCSLHYLQLKEFVRGSHIMSSRFLDVLLSPALSADAVASCPLRQT